MIDQISLVIILKIVLYLQNYLWMYRSDIYKLLK